MNQTKIIALVVLIVTLGAGVFFYIRSGNWLFLAGAAVLAMPDVLTLVRDSTDGQKR